MLKRPMYFFLGAIIIMALSYHYFQDKNLKTNSFMEEGNVCARGVVEKVIEKENSVAVYLRDAEVYGNTAKMECSHLLIYAKELPETLICGMKVEAEGKLEYFKTASNPGQFDEKEYYRLQNITAKIVNGTILVISKKVSLLYQSMYRIKTYFKNSFACIFNKKDAGVAEAMVLGEKQQLDQDMKQLYQSAGIAHILAISGLHISFVGMCIFGLFRKSGIHIYAAIIVCIGVIWYYGKLTNFSVSTNRAVVMMAVMLFARIIGRTYDMQSAAALSASMILLQQPEQIKNCGFLLSFGAIIGIALIYPSFESVFLPQKTEPIPQWKKQKLQYMILLGAKRLIQSILFSLSINLVTFPVILYFYYEIPLYSILLNLMIIPLVSIVLVCLIMAGLFGGVCLPLGYLFAGPVHVIFILYEKLSEITLRLPFSIITAGKPDLWKIILYYIVLAGVCIALKCFSRKRLVLLLTAATILLCVPKPIKGLQITFLDVGQGDCIFMKNGNGSTYLIDCGSSDEGKVGTYRLCPFLKATGNQTLDYVIVTHTDSDHINGIQELLESAGAPGSIQIGTLILPEIAEVLRDDKYNQLIELANKTNISVRYIEKGALITDNKLNIACLHPYKEFVTDSSNAYSTVLSVQYGKTAILLTGDLEKEGETSLIEAGLKDYDILKVAHHGSKYSTSEEFLNDVKADYAILSYGHKNRYGHPHKELLSRLEEKNVILYHTETDGAITAVTDGEHITFQTFLQEK